MDRVGVAHVAFNLARNGGIAADRKDLGRRVELGQQARCLARFREDDDGLRADVGSDLHGRRGGRFDVGQHAAATLRLLHQQENGVVPRGVGGAKHRLSFPARAGHDLHRRLGEVAVGGLPRKHHAVGAIEHGVRHVGALGARRPRVGDHRFEHLSRDDTGLARVATLLDHQLLLTEDLLRRDLHPEVAARHHHAVGGLEDLVELVQALLVLNLRDNLDAGALWTERVPNELDVRCGLHEGSRDVVDTLGHGKVDQVVDVLGLQDRQVDLDVGQVHVLALADGLVVLDTAHDRALQALGHRQHQRAVGDQHGRPRRDRRGEALVCAGDLCLVTFEVVVGGELNRSARLQVNFAAASLFKEAGADLGAFGVQEDSEVGLWPLCRRLSHALEAGPVPLVVTMRKVEARGVHPRVDERQ
mmetsp:Transcript_4128/g.6827  ORF Transcript_4128/g.6827 Transcript_4128/m.6827 type:complete len:416 (-) Transcript_4128:111-1358(-)